MAETTDRYEQSRIFLGWYAGMRGPSLGKPKFSESATVMLLTLGMPEFREKGYYQKGFQISFGFSPPCISENVIRLEEQGLVERLPVADSQDSRQKVIRLTEKGIKTYDEMAHWFSEYRKWKPVQHTQEAPRTF